MSSYRRVASKALNNEAFVNTRLSSFVRPVETGIVSQPFSVNSPFNNGIVISNGTSSGGHASSKVTYDGSTLDVSGNLDVRGDTSTTRLYQGDVLTIVNHGTGLGITGATKNSFDINTIKIAGLFCTIIKIDLSDFSVGAVLNGIIGKSTITACQLLTFNDETHGRPIRIEMLCNETPDIKSLINLSYGDNAGMQGDVPTLIQPLMTGGVGWISPGSGTLTLGTPATGYAQSIIPLPNTNGKFLFLTSGDSAAGGEYDAGKFIIKIWGAPAGFINFSPPP